MKYIAECYWKNNEIEFFIFSKTEKHYISEYDEDYSNIGMMYIWLSGATFGEYRYKNEKFDPGDSESHWIIKKKYIYDDFDMAKLSFFKQLFRD
ncbi:MAG: hypothetical protein ACOC3V_04220 [bacterium]